MKDSLPALSAGKESFTAGRSDAHRVSDGFRFQVAAQPGTQFRDAAGKDVHDAALRPVRLAQQRNQIRMPCVGDSVKLDPRSWMVLNAPTGEYLDDNAKPASIDDLIDFERVLATLPSLVSYMMSFAPTRSAGRCGRSDDAIA